MPGRIDPFAPTKKKSASPRANSLLWIIEPLERDAGYTSRKMFGSDAAYLDGLLYLIAVDRDDPWNGLLVATSKEHHAALMDEMPGLRPHSVLGKWLYVPQDDEAFEKIAWRMGELALARDPRIGVEPTPRSRRGINASQKTI